MTRRQRWDAGVRRLTERDGAVLAWLVEQYAAPHAVVGRLLAACSPGGGIAGQPAAASRWAARMEAAGLVERRHLFGQVWLVPTAAGLRSTGLGYERWSLEASAWTLRHVATVGRLRLALQAQYPGARWESERAIRHRWAGSGARVRRTDGGLHWPEGGATGVEVELGVKKLHRYQGVVTDADPAWSEVWWFAPASLVGRLRERLAEAGGGEVHQVYELPEGVAS